MLLYHQFPSAAISLGLCGESFLPPQRANTLLADEMMVSFELWNRLSVV